MHSSEFFTAISAGHPPADAGGRSVTEQRAQLDRGPVVAPLSHLGFVSVRGPDSVAFMHGQLTCDLKHQAPGTVQPGAYCQAKGRMLASFLQWQAQDAGEPTVELALSREIVPAIVKRMSMFVLRAKAKLADVSEDRVAFGWIGDAARFPAVLETLPSAPETVHGLAQAAGVSVMRLPDALGRNRYIVIAAATDAPSVWEKLCAKAESVDPWCWRLSELHAGIPRIVAATQELFVPQMVNFELIGGVNFKKGCYPGQEVVARSQYLGKLKRRMFLATTRAHIIKPGDDVAQLGATEPVGKVVNVEPNGLGGSDLLIETTLAASEGQLAVHGSSLQLMALPYSLPNEQSAA